MPKNQTIETGTNLDTAAIESGSSVSVLIEELTQNGSLNFSSAREFLKSMGAHISPDKKVGLMHLLNEAESIAEASIQLPDFDLQDTESSLKALNKVLGTDAVSIFANFFPGNGDEAPSFGIDAAIAQEIIAPENVTTQNGEQRQLSELQQELIVQLVEQIAIKLAFWKQSQALLQLAKEGLKNIPTSLSFFSNLEVGQIEGFASDARESLLQLESQLIQVVEGKLIKVDIASVTALAMTAQNFFMATKGEPGTGVVRTAAASQIAAEQKEKIKIPIYSIVATLAAVGLILSACSPVQGASPEVESEAAAEAAAAAAAEASSVEGDASVGSEAGPEQQILTATVKGESYPIDWDNPAEVTKGLDQASFDELLVASNGRANGGSQVKIDGVIVEFGFAPNVGNVLGEIWWKNSSGNWVELVGSESSDGDNQLYSLLAPLELPQPTEEIEAAIADAQNPIMVLLIEGERETILVIGPDGEFHQLEVPESDNPSSGKVGLFSLVLDKIWAGTIEVPSELDGTDYDYHWSAGVLVIVDAAGNTLWTREASGNWVKEEAKTQMEILIQEKLSATTAQEEIARSITLAEYMNVNIVSKEAFVERSFPNAGELRFCWSPQKNEWRPDREPVDCSGEGLPPLIVPGRINEDGRPVIIDSETGQETVTGIFNIPGLEPMTIVEIYAMGQEKLAEHLINNVLPTATSSTHDPEQLAAVLNLVKNFTFPLPVVIYQNISESAVNYPVVITGNTSVIAVPEDDKAIDRVPTNSVLVPVVNPESGELLWWTSIQQGTNSQTSNYDISVSGGVNFTRLSELKSSVLGGASSNTSTAILLPTAYNGSYPQPEMFLFNDGVGIGSEPEIQQFIAAIEAGDLETIELLINQTRFLGVLPGVVIQLK
jgi:hypothetical protein